MKRRFWYNITDALGLLMLLGVTVFVLVRWQSIPAQVPAHFGAGGEITAYGNKASGLVSLLVFIWIMAVAMEVLGFFPQSWNLPRRTPRAYQAAADTLAVLRVGLNAFLAYLLLCTALCRGLGPWLLPALIALVVGTLAYLLIQSFRR